MNANLALLNQATTMRNLDWRRAQRARENGDLRSVAHYTTLALAWECKARKFAKAAGTKLVRMPDNPSALVAQVFVGMFSW